MKGSYWDTVTSGRLSRRRLLSGAATVGAGAAALGVVGCGSGGSGGTSAASKTKIDPNALVPAWQLADETKDAVGGGTFLSFKSTDVIGNWDPYTTTSRSSTLDLTVQVYETPLEIEAGPGIDPTKPAKYIPSLAESFELTADQVSFKIRQPVYFHPIAPVNGRQVDIDDWRVSNQRSVASTYRPSGLDIFEMDKAQFPDSKTMTMKAKFPYAPGPGLFTSGTTAFYVMPKEADGKGMDAGTQVIGTAYRYVSSYQPAIGFEFKKQEKYWRTGKPYMDRWLYPIIPEYANRQAQFLAKNISVYTPNQGDVLQMRKDLGTADGSAILQKADLSGGLTVSYFGFKELDTAPWKDERVRQAISMVIDRKARYEYFQSAADFAAAGIPKVTRYNTHFSGGSFFWLDAQTNGLGDISKVFQFNVAEAKKLMTAAGFPDAIDIDTWAHTGTNYGAQYFESATIFNDMLTNSGLFKVHFHPIPYTDWLPNIYQQRNYKGLALVHPGFGGNGDNDLSLYGTFDSAAGLGWRGIKDPQLETMIDNQRRELDTEKRKNLMYDIQKYLAKTMPLIPTEGVADSFYFRYPWVHNYSYGPSLWNVWLSKDDPKRDG